MFIISAIVVLIFVIIYQIARSSEYAAVLKGEEAMARATNRTIGWLLVIFFVLFMYGIYACNAYLMPKLLPKSASVQGEQYDFMFNITLLVTGIVFFLTQTALFWFAWRYQSTEKRTAFFYSHNNKLELIWTTIPAIAMAVLVAIGLKNWMSVTSAAPANAQIVEVVGKQFNWVMRYPGADHELGKRDFRKIEDGKNILGQDFDGDRKNMDDIISENGELHIVKGRPVKLIIGARDVIHDVGLPHFRYKMDAVPGITTTIWLTPSISTEEMKALTGNPNFVYEISCDQMCGKGHYSMRGTVIVHQTQAELDEWLASQKSYYASVYNPAPAAPAAEGAAPAGGAAPATDSAATMGAQPAKISKH